MSYSRIYKLPTVFAAGAAVAALLAFTSAVNTTEIGAYAGGLSVLAGLVGLMRLKESELEAEIAPVPPT